MTPLEPEVCFGPYQLDIANARLLREGCAVALTPKALQLLHHLASRPEKLVTKRELLSAVWPDVVVSDASIKVCVGEIRKALEDGAKRPKYIETVHRRGYRFIGECSRSQDAGQSIPPKHFSSAQAFSPAAKPVQSGPFVGRDHELRRLGEMFELAQSNQRQVLFISGGAGE